MRCGCRLVCFSSVPSLVFAVSPPPHPVTLTLRFVSEFGVHRKEGARSPPPTAPPTPPRDADRRCGAASIEVEHLSLHDHDDAVQEHAARPGHSPHNVDLQSGCADQIDHDHPESSSPLASSTTADQDVVLTSVVSTQSPTPPTNAVSQQTAAGIQHSPAAKSTSHPHPERTVPKCVRRLKAASSPGFGDGNSAVDAWVSESDLLRRPWSQICSERDAERLVVQAAKSCALTGSMVAGLDSNVDMNPAPSAGSGGLSSKPPSGASARGASPQPANTTSTATNIFSRFSSMRTQSAKLADSPCHVTATTAAAAASEGVLQKFRKSFSARFYKKAAAAASSSKETSPSTSSPSLKPLRHASWTTYLDQSGEGEDVTSSDPCLGVSGSGGSMLNTSSVSSEASGASVDVGGCASDTLSVGTTASSSATSGETLFRLGPIVWRSSKERKEKSRQNKKDAARRQDSAAGSGAEDRPDSAEVCGVDVDAKSEVSTESSVNMTPSSNSPVCQVGHNTHPSGGISHVLRRRAQSTSLRSERPKRPLSDQGGTIHGSIVLPNGLKMLKSGDYDLDDYRGNPHHIVRKGSAGPSLCPSTGSSSGVPPFVVIKRDRRMPGLRWSRGRSNLRRSVSQPLEMEKLDCSSGVGDGVGSGRGNRASHGGLSDQEDHAHDISSASSQEDIPSDSENGGSTTRGLHKCNSNTSGEDDQLAEPVVYAEALWDHVTMDHEELAFKAGELVAVLDDMDSEWWWGVVGCRSGWFPASFVRARVNQEGSVEECTAEMKDGTLGSRKMSVSLLNTDQVRTNVIMEIISTERDFVRHLRDVCEGYLKQVRKRLDMFPEESVSTIFGNIEQLFAFQSDFVSKLELCINWEKPHLSQIGTCFTEHKEGFEIYSEYCNNHPQAVNELQQLYANPKYSHFFEACRLLQDMIDISLDGFLLTPVQKICKYPLQLGELLKYTKPEHPDYVHVARALETMRSVAHYINERKRRMECLEKLAAWQMSVEYWEGQDLLDNCSELIHSGDVYKVTASWSRDFTLFLFDHQLIICKKDLLKRNTYSYKGRVDMDKCQIRDIPDGKDPHSGLTLKNSWKLYCSERDKWLVFATRTAEEKDRWMKAFDDERWRVDEDKAKGFVVTEKAKKMALMVVLNRRKPKRPKEKENKNLGRRLTRPELYVVSSKSGSLPSNLVLSTASKKKTSSGWFHFGSNKKTKR